MAGRLVTVAAFLNVNEAHLFRIRLEQHGIPSFVAEDTTMEGSSLDPFGSSRLVVKEEDADTALQILNGTESS